MDRLPDDREVELLDEAECLRLLTTAAIGRVAFTEGALPAVQPVSFLLCDAEIYIPASPGSKVAAASRGAVVAFEVDDVDASARTGWSVTVVGPSRVIVDAVEVRRLDGAGVRPWAPGGDHCYIGIAVRMVQGRRISRPGAAAGLPVPSEDVPPHALPA